MLTNDLKHLLMMQPVRVNPEIAEKHRDEAEINRMLGIIFDADMEQRDASLVWDGIDFKIPKVNNNFARMLVDVYANVRLLLSPSKKDVIKIFGDIKNSIRDEKLDEKIVETYTNFVETNYSGLQTFLNGTVRQKAAVLTKETKASNNYKNISESDLIKFILNSERGLVMDEIKFYRRTIPQNVQQNIDEAIEEKVFDNIYILYYDVTPSPFFMKIKHDKAKKCNIIEDKLKDPIAFGVISGSDRLYFIDDWIDEYCNLQFQNIVDFLNEDKENETSSEEV